MRRRIRFYTSLLSFLCLTNFLSAQSSEIEFHFNRSVYVSIPGYIIEASVLEGSDNEAPVIVLRKYDCHLNETAYNSITIEQFKGKLFIAGGTYNDINSGVIQFSANNRNLDLLSLSINTDLKELCRTYLSRDEGKRSPKLQALYGVRLNGYQREVYSPENAWTEDGRMYLNSGDGSSGASLSRYVIKENQYVELWKTNLEGLNSIWGNKMIVSGNKLFMQVRSNMVKAQDQGIVSVFCFDYQSGLLLWKTEFDRQEALRYEFPCWTYDSITDRLILAGIATAPRQWKKVKREGKAPCKFFMGGIDASGKLELIWKDAPAVTVPGVSEEKTERPIWLPKTIVRKTDGTYVIAGPLGFLFYTEGTGGNGDYLNSATWVGGLLVGYYSPGNTEKWDMLLFPVIQKPTTHAAFLSTTFYWDVNADKLYMGLLNPNEGTGVMANNFTVGYYLFTVESGKISETLLRKQECHLNNSQAQAGSGHAALFAVSPTGVLYSPWVKGPWPEKISSMKLE